MQEGEPDMVSLLEDTSRNLTILLPPEKSIALLRQAQNMGSLTKEQVSQILRTHVLLSVADITVRDDPVCADCTDYDSPCIQRMPQSTIESMGGSTVKIQSVDDVFGFKIQRDGPKKGMEGRTRGSFAALKCMHQPYCPRTCKSTGGSLEILPIVQLLSPVDLSTVPPFKETSIDLCRSEQFLCVTSTLSLRGCPKYTPACPQKSLPVDTDRQGGGGTSNSTETELAMVPDSLAMVPEESVMSKRLTGGQVTGIVWAGVGLLLLVAAFFVWRMVRRRPQQHEAQDAHTVDAPAPADSVAVAVPVPVLEMVSPAVPKVCSAIMCVPPCLST